MMERGIITTARDFLFAGWKQAGNSDEGYFPLSGTDMDNAAIRQGNYESQIAANKGIVYACVKLLANSVAANPLRVYRAKRKGEKSAFRVTRTKEVSEPRKTELLEKAVPGSALSAADDVEEIVSGHRLVELLYQVNSVTDNFGLKYLTSAYLSLIGNCYWVLFRDGLRLPSTIWVAPAEFMKPVPDNKGDVEKYVYRHGIIKKVFDADDVIHFKQPAPGFHFQYYGRGDLMAAADAFNLRQYIQKFEEGMFKNGALPAGVLSTSKSVGEQERKRLREAFREKYGGPENAGKWMVMENVEPKPLSLSPREMAYQQSRRALTEEIPTDFLIPIAMLTGQVSTRAALETSLTQMAMFATQPQCTLIDETANAQLCSQYPDNVFVKFDNPVPDDEEFKLKQQETDLKSGVTAIDEERRARGLQPYGGPASEPMVDATRVPLSAVGEIDIDELARSIAEKIRISA